MLRFPKSFGKFYILAHGNVNLYIVYFLFQIYVPRLLQALVGTWTEWSFTKSSKSILNGSQMSWFVLLQLGNHFLYYVASRTLANTLEMNFTLLGISYFLNQHRGKQNQ